MVYSFDKIVKQNVKMCKSLNKIVEACEKIFLKSHLHKLKLALFDIHILHTYSTSKNGSTNSFSVLISARVKPT